MSDSQSSKPKREYSQNFESGKKLLDSCKENQPERIEDAYKRLFIARFEERGIDAEYAVACYEAGAPYDDMTPEEAADTEIEQMTDDGDE